jgi:phage shock protein A
MIEWTRVRLAQWGRWSRGRTVLVKLEYSQDRLRADIRDLEEKIKQMERDREELGDKVMVAEIALSVVVFTVGFFVGRMT